MTIAQELKEFWDGEQKRRFKDMFDSKIFRKRKKKEKKGKKKQKSEAFDILRKKTIERRPEYEVAKRGGKEEERRRE